MEKYNWVFVEGTNFPNFGVGLQKYVITAALYINEYLKDI